MSILLEPIQSVAVFSFYREVPRKSGLAVFGYLAYLGAVFALVATVALRVRVGPAIQEGAEWAAKNIPTLTLAGGKVSKQDPEAVVIRHPEASALGFKIDTLRVTAITPAEMEEDKLIAFLTQSVLYVRTANRLEAYDLSKSVNAEPVVIDAAFYRKVGGLLGKVLYPVAFLTMWLLFLAWKPLAALVYSVLALMVNAAVSGGLEFPALYKIAVYAQTPVVVLQMAAVFLPRPIPLFRLLALLVVSVYVWQAIRQNRPDSAGAPE